MEINTNPQISIITITRNRADFIVKAIESAQKQGFTNWELIVLDDDSNDGTGAIIEAFKAKDGRIKYYKNPSILGISKNRNLGLSKARGKYIAMLDSDDEWIDKDKLQKQIDILEKDNSIGLVGSAMNCVDENGTFLYEEKTKTNDKDIRNNILIHNQIFQSSVMFRKKAIDEIGNYDENLVVAEDFDLWLRIGKKYKFANLKESTIAYTIHSGGISKNRKLLIAWNHLMIVLKNFGKYPNWFSAIIFAKLRLLKNIFSK
jgi:glycosyltransferase involved in cell wall biosynthesis